MTYPSPPIPGQTIDKVRWPANDADTVYRVAWSEGDGGGCSDATFDVKLEVRVIPENTLSLAPSWCAPSSCALRLSFGWVAWSYPL